jgi:hypothetical protein
MAIRLGLLIAGLIGFQSLEAGATVKITGVAGASTYNITSGTTPIIYGGRGGTLQASACEVASPANDLMPCDGCANATGPMVCNRKRVYPNLRLRISFTSDTATGRPLILSGSSVVDFEAGSVAKGGTATLDVTWSILCPYLSDGNASCDTSSTPTSQMQGDFVVGIDSNNDNAFGTGDDSTTVKIIIYDPDPTGSGDYNSIDECPVNDGLPSPKPGICYFMAYPGDKKIFAEDLDAGISGFPTTPTGQVSAVNFYSQETDFQNFLPNTTPKSIAVSAITGGYELVDKVVDGLDNNTNYFFRTSVSDPAGNEMLFTSDANISFYCGILNPAPPFDGTGGGNECPYAARPDEVLGLLSDNLNCFIATAAYGSPFHPIVSSLREFRNRFLLPYEAGRRFVGWYYSWSPKAAHWLKQNDWWRPVAQAALIPVWIFGLAFIWWPISLALLIVGICVYRKSSRTKVFRA